MTLLRYDGSTVSADKQLVTTKRPTRIVLPKKANTPDLARLSAALGAAGPEDNKAIAAYIKAGKKYDNCAYKYICKNDPSWGKGHDDTERKLPRLTKLPVPYPCSGSFQLPTKYAPLRTVPPTCAAGQFTASDATSSSSSVFENSQF